MSYFYDTLVSPSWMLCSIVDVAIAGTLTVLRALSFASLADHVCVTRERTSALSSVHADPGRNTETELSSLIQVIQDDVIPSPLRHSFTALRHARSDFRDDESARVAFFAKLLLVSRMFNSEVHGRVSVANAGERVVGNFQRSWASGFGDQHTEVVLFGKDIEFFTALQLIEDTGMISVVVGPSFPTVDLSFPRLCGKFHILSHESESFDISDDNGLLAVHPSALCMEKTASSVLRKLQGNNIVIGIDPTLGRMLADLPSDDKLITPAWQHAVVDWGRRHVRKNGPYLIFRSFCDALYPLSFCAPGFSGFDDRARGMDSTLNQVVGMALLSLQERLPAYPESVSFVSIFISGVLALDAVIVPLSL